MASLTSSGWQLPKLKKRSKMQHMAASLLYISWTVWDSITKFYRHIHAYLPYICTGYGITMYFRSEATVKTNSRKCRLRRLWVEFWWRGVLPPHQLVGFLFVFRSIPGISHHHCSFNHYILVCNKMLKTRHTRYALVMLNKKAHHLVWAQCQIQRHWWLIPKRLS